jgi:transcriptional regulator with XRE-family HTH domain
MRGEKDEIIWKNVERILLEKKDWTLARLAKEMGVQPQQITGLKRRGIGARSLNKLAAVLGVTETYLLTKDIEDKQQKEGTAEVEYLKKRIEDLENDKRELLSVIKALSGSKETPVGKLYSGLA